MLFSLNLFAVVAIAITATAKATTDIDALNYALTLEFLENYFYNKAVNGGVTQSALNNVSNDSGTYANFQLIASHEAAHVSYLKTAIASLKGTPVTACSAYAAVDSTCFLSTASSPTAAQIAAAALACAVKFENLGTRAYDGAISSISNYAVQQAAGTIATIEGRHAAYLNQYQASGDANSGATTTALGSNWNFGTGVDASGNAGNSTAFAGGSGAAYDGAMTPSAVASAITSLISSCTNTLTLPVPRTAPAAYKTQTISNAPTITLSQNDINTLQYALFLENFEAAFYLNYIGTTGGSAGQFVASDFQSYFGTSNSNAYSAGIDISSTAGNTGTQVLARLQVITAHEVGHAAFLNAAITSLGVTPITTCTGYTFPAKSGSFGVAQFLAYAAAIEGAGVSAYTGVVNAVTSPAFAQAAATIATVEARHAQYLTYLTSGGNSGSVFTNDTATNGNAGPSFDSPATPTSIVATLKSLATTPGIVVPTSCYPATSAYPVPVQGYTSSASIAGKSAAVVAGVIGVLLAMAL